MQAFGLHRIHEAKWIKLAFVLFAASSTLVSQQPDTTGTPVEKNYLRRVHFGDLVDIHVPGHLDLDWRGRVNPEGFLDGYEVIPKQIYALCRTESEIAAEITSELAVQIRDPKTEVKIVDISMRPVATIEGAIAYPTRFQLRREIRLIELITLAGGITDRSSGIVTIFRPEGQSCIGKAGGGEPKARATTETIEIADLLAGKKGSNPVVVSGDLIMVSESFPVYITGAVAAQGRVDHRPNLTLSRLVDASGGPQKDAALSNVMIFRRNGQGSETIVADLEKIRSNLKADIELKPFDIIDVPFKGRPPKKFPPVIEAEADAAGDRNKLPLKIIE